MEKRDSMLDAYLRKGLSRRSFLKGCVALTTLMGLSTDMLDKVVEAAETKPLPVVVWIHGHECTGCDESFIRSGAPMTSDVVLNTIALEYDHLLSAASGEPFEHHLEETIKKYDGQYILAVEGMIFHFGIVRFRKQLLMLWQLLLMVPVLLRAVFRLLSQILPAPVVFPISLVQSH